MPTDTRARMVRAAAESFRVRGLAATSFTQVLEASGAARGAIYHHFPGGKAELAQAAVGWFGDQVAGRLRALDDGSLAAPSTPADVLDRFLTLARPVVAESAGCAGCPVAAVALECTREDDPLLEAAHGAFTAWIGELTQALTNAGLAAADAQALGTLMITTLEGAHILCRAAGSLEPFDRAAAALRRCIAPGGPSAGG
jgi:TetR/AcrR family transcriptional regulator, lmrAB and yxaGH operons repressor